MPEGNGEPALCLFPEEVTPNHHALAQEFVLLDNFYVESEVSADGHEWTMGAYATDFVERTWPLSYRGDKRVPYPAEGAFADRLPGRRLPLGSRRGQGRQLSQLRRVHRQRPEARRPGQGEGRGAGGALRPVLPQLRPRLSRREARRAVPGGAGGIRGEGRDAPADRAPAAERPHLRHARPAPDRRRRWWPTTTWRLGMVVEGLSKSQFWPDLAIFVVEDDAQNGSDHVDAHRTVALAISPYIKRHSVDSTLYSTSSMLRTMELILGLEPMSQFDAAARPMCGVVHQRARPDPLHAPPARRRPQGGQPRRRRGVPRRPSGWTSRRRTAPTT